MFNMKSQISVLFFLLLLTNCQIIESVKNAITKEKSESSTKNEETSNELSEKIKDLSTFDDLDSWTVVSEPTTLFKISSDKKDTSYGSQSAKLTFLISKIGNAGKMFKIFEDSTQDWSMHKGLFIVLKGDTNESNYVRVEIVDADREYYQAVIPANTVLWKKFKIPFKTFKKGSVQPEEKHNLNDGLSLNNIHEISFFTSHEGKGTWKIDYLGLY